MPFTQSSGISPTRSIKTPYSPLISDQGDLIVGGLYGLPQRLPKGGPGQVLGVNPQDGTVGYFTFTGGFQNPMTGVGDMIVGGPGGTAQRLAAGLNGKFLSLVAGTPAWVDVQALPSMVGYAGKFLQTDGTKAQWATVDALPAQAGQSGKFLTTDGSSVSWSFTPSGFANPMTTLGDIIVAGDGGAAQRLAIGASGHLLTVVGGKPQWAARVSDLPAQGGNAGKYLTTNGSAVSWASVQALPPMTGKAGLFLMTDGTNAGWDSPLPAQTGNSGKALVTDGATPSWKALIPTMTGQSGKILTTDGTSTMWAPATQTALPSQPGNEGKYLTTNGNEAYWGAALNSVMGSTQVVFTKSPRGTMDGVLATKGGPLVLSLYGNMPSDTKIPYMTSAATPAGMGAKWSSAYNTSTQGWNIFSEPLPTTSGGWITNGTPPTTSPAWVQLTLPSPTKLATYTLTPWSADNFPSRSPLQWKIQGSLDETTWVDLDTQVVTAGFWVLNTPCPPITIASPGAYKHYRIYITQNAGDSYTGLKNLQFFQDPQVDIQVGSTTYNLKAIPGVVPIQGLKAGSYPVTVTSTGTVPAAPWTLTATEYNPVDGGWTFFSPDNPFKTPSALDDEFEGADITKWATRQGWGTGGHSFTMGSDGPTWGTLSSSIKNPSGGEILHGIFQDIPSPDWTCWVKFSQTYNNGQHSFSGLVFRNGTDNTQIHCGQLNKMGVYLSTRVVDPVTGVVSSVSDISSTAYGGNTVYVRAVKSGTSLVFHYSPDGASWTQVGAITLTTPTTPTKVGLFQYSHIQSYDTSFDFFRLATTPNAALGSLRTIGSGGGGSASFPAQDGHAGEFLQTDGKDVKWAKATGLPDQTTHANQWLTTDGKDATWRDLPGTGGDQGLRLLGNIPQVIEGAALGIMGGDLVVAGGLLPSLTPSNKVYKWNNTTQEFQEFSTLPQPFSYSGFCQDPTTETLYMFGTRSGGTTFTSVAMSVSKQGACQRLADLPGQARSPKAAWLTLGPNAGKILVVGGSLGGTSRSNLCYFYDPVANTYTQGPNITTGVDDSGIVTLQGGPYKGSVLVMGGWQTPGLVQKYDPILNSWSTLPTPTPNKGGDTGHILGSAALSDGRVIINPVQMGRFYISNKDLTSWDDLPNMPQSVSGGYQMVSVGNYAYIGLGITATDQNWLAVSSVWRSVFYQRDFNALLNPYTSLLNPMTTKGDMIVAGPMGSPKRIPGGKAGQILGVDKDGEVKYLDPNTGIYGISTPGVYSERDPMMPPVRPNIQDDEFFTPSTTVPVKWTPVNWNDSSVPFKFDISTTAPGKLWAQVATGGADTQRCLLQPIPTGDFTAWTRVRLYAPQANWSYAGLILSTANQPGTGTQCVVWTLNNSSGMGSPLSQMMSNFSSYNGAVYSGPSGNSTVYLRIRRSGSDFKGAWSQDGMQWTEFTIPQNPYTYIGVDFGNNNSGATIQAEFDFFRMANSGEAVLDGWIVKGNSLYNPMTSQGEMLVGGTLGAAVKVPAGLPGQLLGVKPDGTVGFVDYFGASAIELVQNKSDIKNPGIYAGTNNGWVGYSTFAKVSSKYIIYAANAIVPVISFTGSTTFFGYCYKVIKDTNNVVSSHPLTLNGSKTIKISGPDSRLDPVVLEFNSKYDYWIILTVTAGPGDNALYYSGDGGGGLQGFVATETLSVIPTPGTGTAGNRVALQDVLLVDGERFIPGAKIQAALTSVWDNIPATQAMSGTTIVSTGGPLEFTLTVQNYSTSGGEMHGYFLMADNTLIGEVKQFFNETNSHKSQTKTFTAQLPPGSYNLKLSPLGPTHAVNATDLCSLTLKEYTPNTLGTFQGSFEVDLPPDLPSMMDDEFQAPKSVWTRLNWDSLDWDAGITYPGKLRAVLPSSKALYAMSQPLPSGDFVAYAKAQISGTGVQDAWGGSALWVGTPGSQVAVYSTSGKTTTRSILNWANFNTPGTESYGAPSPSPHPYLMLRRVSGNWTAGWSQDGQVWTTQAFTPGVEPTLFGIGGTNLGSNHNSTLTFDFFRVFTNPFAKLGNWMIRGKETAVIKQPWDLIVGDPKGLPMRFPKGASGEALVVQKDGSLGWSVVEPGGGPGPSPSGGSGGGNVYYTEDFDLGPGDGVKTEFLLKAEVPVEDVHYVNSVGIKTGTTITPAPALLVTNYLQTEIKNWSNGADFSLTPSAIPAPDGSTGKVVVCKTTSKVGRVNGPIATQPTNENTHSVWLKADSPGQIWLGTNNGAAWGSGPGLLCNVTTEWKQFSLQAPKGMAWMILSSANPTIPSLDPAQSLPPVEVYAWGGQVETGTVAHFPVPAGTTGALPPYEVKGNKLIMTTPPPVGSSLVWTGVFASGKGSIPNSRKTFPGKTKPLTQGQSDILTLDASKASELISIQVESACRVRVYGTLTAAQADLPRPSTKDPEGNHGVQVELLLNAPQVWVMAPSATLYNLDTPVSPKVYVTIDALEDAPTGVRFTLTVLEMETNVSPVSSVPMPSLDGNTGKYLRVGPQGLVWDKADALPDQTGNNGKYLTTNGTSASWATVEALPDQTGKGGRFLKTNGTTASWEEVQNTPNGRVFKVGDGVKTSFSLDHNLGTEDLTVSVWRGPNMVLTPLHTDGLNKVVVEFSNAPLKDEIKVVVQGLNVSTSIPTGLMVNYEMRTASLIPSTTGVDPHVIYSSQYGDQVGWEAWRCFSDTDPKGWADSFGNPKPGWIGWNFGTKTLITQYTLTPFTFDTFEARKWLEWRLEGSDDGTTWTPLDTRTSTAGEWSTTPRTFTCNPTSLTFNRYRVVCVKNNGDTFIALRKLELIGEQVVFFTSLPDGRKFKLQSAPY